MQLEEQDIREFCELWRLEFNEKLSPGEAQTRASVLLELYAVLAAPHAEHDQRSPNDPSR